MGNISVVPEISYDKLREKINENGISFSRIGTECVGGFAAQSIRKQKSLSLKTIDRLCKYFNCQPDEVIEFIPSEKPLVDIPEKVRILVDFSKLENVLKVNGYTYMSMTAEIGKPDNYFSKHKRFQAPSLPVYIIKQVAGVIGIGEDELISQIKQEE